MKVTVDDNGASHYTVRQSGFKDWLACPEMARRKWYDGLRSNDSDATVTGTALHLYIENRCTGHSQEEARQEATVWLQQRVDARDFDFLQVKTGQTMFRNLNTMIESFESDIWQHVPEVEGVEVGFDVLFDERVGSDGPQFLHLSGTIDMIDTDGGLWDWKSAGDIYRQYEQWQIDRYYPQPTVYCAARSVEAGEDPFTTRQVSSFTFGVMQKGTTPKAQMFVTSRDAASYRFLARQLWAIVDQYDNLGPQNHWPLIDQSFLCSAKWCPNWADCKGGI